MSSYSPILIAHRGNIDGPDPSTENHPNKIIECIDKGFDVEIDLWYNNSTLRLGHDDESGYQISHLFLIEYHHSLWIHCKNLNALYYMSKCIGSGFNYFWHQTDDFTLTSLEYIWTFPGKQLCSRSVAVCPDQSPGWEIPVDVGGICSDNIKEYV